MTVLHKAAAELPRRRRLLSSDSSAMSAAKTRFMETVQAQMKTLMQDHGYSRERATRTLVLEISGNGTSARGSSSNNGDQKVYDAMNRFGLTTEQAIRALTVASALENLCRENVGMTSLQALKEMTARLAQSNLADREDDFFETDPSVPTSLHRAGKSCSISRNHSKDLVLLPAAAASAATRSETPRPKSPIPLTKKPAKTGKAGRKRSVDEIVDSATGSENNKPTRARSDSEEVVQAKFAENSKTTVSSVAAVQTKSTSSSAAHACASGAASSSACPRVVQTNKRSRQLSGSSEDVVGASSSTGSQKRARPSLA